jgi:hypothetical protein
MLEIVALYFLCKKMGERLRAKGWTKPVWMQIAVVLAWFGCMFLGSVAYGVYVVIKEGEAAAQDVGFSVYPIALISGAAGVGLLFLIAGMFPNRLPPPLLNE